LIRAHYDALQRAFRNLVRNAVEAMQPRPGTGHSAGTTAAADAPGDTAPRHELAVTITSAGGGVRVSIADTGHGIPADRIDRLFEPDFTLKAGGTGLGLAVVRQAVAAHGGRVSAQAR